jgi:hypothetical protein
VRPRTCRMAPADPSNQPPSSPDRCCQPPPERKLESQARPCEARSTSPCPRLGLLVVPTQEVGHRPNRGRMVFDRAFCLSPPCAPRIKSGPSQRPVDGHLSARPLIAASIPRTAHRRSVVKHHDEADARVASVRIWRGGRNYSNRDLHKPTRSNQLCAPSRCRSRIWRISVQSPQVVYKGNSALCDRFSEGLGQEWDKRGNEVRDARVFWH